MKRFFLMLAALLPLVSSCSLFESPDIVFKDGMTPEVSFNKAGGQASIQFKATGSWTATPSESWCTVSPASGEAGDVTLNVKAAANNTPDGRSATIQLTCGEVRKLVNVSQAQKDVLEVSVPSLEVGEEGGDVSIEVSSNVAYSCKIAKGEEWISSLGTKALQTKQQQFRIKANETEEDRTGEIEFISEEAGVFTRVTVSQKAPDVFALSDTETEVSHEGGSFTVTVRSSLKYSISSTPSWVKEVSSKAVSTKVHTFAVEANTEQTGRSDVIVFCNESGVCVPFTVNQEAAPAPEPGPQPSGIDWTKGFAHKSLIMRFTATWCGYCPIMAETLALAQANRPDRYETVSIHGNKSNLEFANYRPLMTEYSISGYPTSVVDGRRTLENYSPAYGVTLVEKFQDETEATYPTASAIGVNSSFTGSELSVTVDVYCKEADSYKLTALVLEDGIVGYQADYNAGDHNDYRHDSVARIALTNVQGDAFSTVEERTVKTFSFKTTVPSGYQEDNLRILVFVQREFGTQKKLTDFKGSFYVDNAASVKAGVKLEPAVK